MQGGEKSSNGASAVRKLLAAESAFPVAVGLCTGGTRTARLGGVTPCGAALLFATLAERGLFPAALIITPTQEQAEDLHAAARAFAPEGTAVHFFPSTERLSREQLDPGSVSARLTVCRALMDRAGPVLVAAPVQAVIEETPAPEELSASLCRLKVGRSHDPEALVEKLAAHGFNRLAQVERPGDFARRGGILDIFPLVRRLPLRVEYDGDEVASLREFDPLSQLSMAALGEVELVLGALSAGRVLPGRGRTIRAYLEPGAVLALMGERDVREKGADIGTHAGLTPSAASRRVDDMLGCARLGLERYASPECAAAFAFAQRPPLGDSMDATCALLKGYAALGTRAFLACGNEGELERLAGVLQDKGAAHGAIEYFIGDVREGFMVGERAVVLSSSEVLGRTQVRRAAPRAAFAGTPAGFFALNPGDLAVHVAHGIGRYLGNEWVEKDGTPREFLVLEYRDGAKLFVPAQKADLVARYVGSGERAPALDALSGGSWRRRCEAVERAVTDMASELLDIQAARLEKPGFAFGADEEWQRQLEASFPFEETPDQLEAVRAVKHDMQSSRCMDRLLCGDVGYGKTEIAVRAAFKAVTAGKQVAVLVPTTVLAEQHYETFRERLSTFPVTVAVLSRFRTRKEQTRILEALGAGGVDILIGTHRLLSGDVRFADLGMVIIDEEQRFGVRHKERFKRMRATVEVLTMTATPIPRTLHMALLGLRDISNLTTPPEGRAPVRTEVCRFDPARVRECIVRELDRDGQVYYVHNRVQHLRRIARELAALVPEARIGIAHGQMAERELSEAMRRFLGRETDVLVTTTLIESGLDISNVNTIFISDADMYGLADLHQLRGRVGRYRHQAYAYFLLPAHRRVGPDAEKRLRAIERHSALGAGFQLALRDLELRGAGNILGGEQSGHIAQVGYDMYCRLLKQCVAGLRSEPAPARWDVTIDLTVAAYLPEAYVPPGLDRVDVYRQIASAWDEADLAQVHTRLCDRFGKAPPPVAMLLALQRLRFTLGPLGIRAVGCEQGRPIFRAGPSFSLARLAGSPWAVRPVEDGVFMLDVPAPDDRKAFNVFEQWGRALACAAPSRELVPCEQRD